MQVKNLFTEKCLVHDYKTLAFARVKKYDSFKKTYRDRPFIGRIQLALQYIQHIPADDRYASEYAHHDESLGGGLHQPDE